MATEGSEPSLREHIRGRAAPNSDSAAAVGAHRAPGFCLDRRRGAPSDTAPVALTADRLPAAARTPRISSTISMSVARVLGAPTEQEHPRGERRRLTLVSLARD